MTDSSMRPARTLPIWGYLLLVIGYLAAVQLMPRLTAPGSDAYASFPTTDAVVRSLWVTVGVGTLIGLVAVAVLGWWRPVFVDTRRLPRWTWAFPALMLVTVLVGINYGNLADRGLTYTVLLLVGCLFIGVSEELMFRGIGVTAFRRAGFSEGKVALWTCVLFGLAHSTNLFTEGIGALTQVLVTAVAGYFFYITLRVSGLLIVPMIVHGLWDFGAITNTLSNPPSLGASAFIIADIVLAILAIVTIRKVFPRRTATPTPTAG
ncbi:lysostaphin resistance A-like protein [Nakamurella sp.]|uniref:lysostaphin resistance A-like protein n=1 Tax=Nakamurella sp. TaxID=1869182 RepID=UPI003784B766